MRIAMTSVTDHWVTVAVVGPRSRDVLTAVAPELDVSNSSFPFMTWRDAIVAGLAARVCRISFSNELAYEVNVPAWNGLALWEALFKVGQPWQITLYGTETMHVLRAEKGYPVIGQDTDGTVTPQDLGMSWVVSKKKPGTIDARAHGAVTRTIGTQLAVLLKNDGPVLPLDAAAGSIVIIGQSQFVDRACLGGGGSSKVMPLYTVAPLDGMRDVLADLGSSATVSKMSVSDDLANLEQARQAAADADIVVLMAGVVARVLGELGGRGHPHGG